MYQLAGKWLKSIVITSHGLVIMISYKTCIHMLATCAPVWFS